MKAWQSFKVLFTIGELLYIKMENQFYYKQISAYTECIIETRHIKAV